MPTIHQYAVLFVEEDWHFYVVPWQYIGKEVRIVYGSDLVEIVITMNGSPFIGGAIKGTVITTA